MDPLREIAKALREERRRRGLTLREVGTLAQLNFSYLSQLEQGKVTASFEVLQRWAGVLNRRIDVLLSTTDIPEPPRLTAAQETTLREVLAALPHLSSTDAAHLAGIATALGRRPG